MSDVDTRWRYIPASGQWLLPSPPFIVVGKELAGPFVGRLAEGKDSDLLRRGRREKHLLLSLVPDVPSQKGWQSEKWTQQWRNQHSGQLATAPGGMDPGPFIEKHLFRLLVGRTCLSPCPAPK